MIPQVSCKIFRSSKISVNDLKSKLEALNGFVKGIIASKGHKEDTVLEKWLQSRFQKRIKDVTANLDELKTRSALQVALFESWNDLRWYIQRKGRTDAEELAEAVKVWVRMLAPFAPFVCEELWSRTGETGFVSVAQWPVCDEKKIDTVALEHENLVMDLITDTSNILKAMKIAPKRICYYTAAPWKWQVYLKVLGESLTGDAKIGDLMKHFSSDKDLKLHMREIAGLVPRILKALAKLSTERKIVVLKIKAVDEKDILDEAVAFLEERFKAEVSVFSEVDENCYDPKFRAAMALPHQPAIFVE